MVHKLQTLFLKSPRAIPQIAPPLIPTPKPLSENDDEHLFIYKYLLFTKYNKEKVYNNQLRMRDIKLNVISSSDLTFIFLLFY